MRLVAISFINTIKQKMTISKIYILALYFLFFMFSVNFMTYGAFFLLLIIILITLKLFICHEIRFSLSLLGVFLFCLTFFFIFAVHFYITYLNNFFAIFRDMCYYIVFPLGFFIVGSNLTKTYYDKQKLIINILTIVVFGFCFHAFLNVLNQVIMHGLFVITPIAPDIWTNERISASDIGNTIPMISSLLFPIFLIKSSYKKRFHIFVALFGLAVSIYSSFVLSSKLSLLFISVLLTSGCTIFFLLEKNKKRRDNMILILCAFVLFAISLMICYQTNFLGLKQFLHKMPLFEHIFTENDGFFIERDRNLIYKVFFDHWLSYPFGGKKIPLIGNGFCYNVWLDIFNITGVVPFLLFTFFTFLVVVQIIVLWRFEKNKYLLTFLTFFAISLFIIFALESVLQANVYIFSLFFLIFGFTDSLHRFYSRKTMKKHQIKTNNIFECKIIFISNFFSIHQIAFVLEMQKKFGKNFHFISLKKYPEGSKKAGCYYDISVECVKEMHENKEDCLELIRNSDIIIYGNAPDKLIFPQLKKGKMIFKFSERIYKSNSNYKYLLPRSIVSQYIHHKRFQKYQFRYLCASAYLPYDLYRFDIDMERCYKWGYFTLENKFKTFDELYKLKANNKVIELIYVNRLVKYKRSDKCIVVAKHLMKKGIGFRLRIIGSGKKEIVDSLQKQINENNLENNVFLLGALNNAEVRKIMEQSDILLAHASFEEGWGACVSEGMESGCVVIASHSHGSVPFLINNYENGLIYEYNNDNDLCDQVDYAIESKETKEKISENAFLTIKNLWSVHNAVNNFIKTTSNLLNNETGNEEINAGPMKKVEVLPNYYFKQEKSLKRNSCNGKKKT